MEATATPDKSTFEKRKGVFSYGIVREVFQMEAKGITIDLTVDLKGHRYGKSLFQFITFLEPKFGQQKSLPLKVLLRFRYNRRRPPHYDERGRRDNEAMDVLSPPQSPSASFPLQPPPPAPLR
jgi:hypothetical protein